MTTGGGGNGGLEQEVQRVLACRDAFQVFGLEPGSVDESELRR